MRVFPSLLDGTDAGEAQGRRYPSTRIIISLENHVCPVGFVRGRSISCAVQRPANNRKFNIASFLLFAQIRAASGGQKAKNLSGETEFHNRQTFHPKKHDPTALKMPVVKRLMKSSNRGRICRYGEIRVPLHRKHNAKWLLMEEKAISHALCQGTLTLVSL